ncbi:hypothetical protein G5B10_08220 [Fluviicola sp. SGL-29]|nr:hypothetical protein [Fluviicola sp. SGL-29]
METKDILTLLAIWAAITGWFINSWLNRRNEISKRRFEYRMTALDSFLKCWFVMEKQSDPFKDAKFIEMVEDSRSKFHLFGELDEIEAFENFISAVEKADLEQANTTLRKLVSIVRQKVRKELNLKKINYLKEPFKTR